MKHCCHQVSHLTQNFSFYGWIKDGEEDFTVATYNMETAEIPPTTELPFTEPKLESAAAVKVPASNCEGL